MPEAQVWPPLDPQVSSDPLQLDWAVEVDAGAATLKLATYVTDVAAATLELVATYATDVTTGAVEEEATGAAVSWAPEVLRVSTAGGGTFGEATGGVRSLPAFGGPLKFPALQALSMAVHLSSQILQLASPVAPAEL